MRERRGYLGCRLGRESRSCHQMDRPGRDSKGKHGRRPLVLTALTLMDKDEDSHYPVYCGCATPGSPDLDSWHSWHSSCSCCWCDAALQAAPLHQPFTMVPTAPIRALTLARQPTLLLLPTPLPHIQPSPLCAHNSFKCPGSRSERRASFLVFFPCGIR